MTDRTYIDIHVLQAVPPSNLNRDDAGSPKQATYGGARRARVSSQAWKRAARRSFADQLGKAPLATRTKKISELLANRLMARGGLDNETAARVSTSMLAPLKIKPGKKAAETAYLLFFGRPQLESLVDLVEDQLAALAAMDDKALTDALKDLPIKDTLGSGHPIDVALFGRMVADIPGLKVDAATQVAHALSTHPVEVEFDYYTAVDDENVDDSGAGMIGTVEFNSATLYRFASVGLHQLHDNLDGDTAATVHALEVFLRAFVTSMPTGHQNSFAHRTLPALVTVAVRDDQPVNLVSAFERPVHSKSGIVDESITRLAGELQKAGELWGVTPLRVVSTYESRGSDTDLASLGEPVPFQNAITTVSALAKERLAEVQA